VSRVPAGAEPPDGGSSHQPPGSGSDRVVLLAITGGIAAYKSLVLARRLRDAGLAVQGIMTPAATRFVGPDSLAALTGRPVYTEVFERTESVLHVRLAHEAAGAVVAPATANVLAKLALGLADDLVTATLLEARGPLVIAPAMHSGMWDHPSTREHLATLRARGAVIVGPVEGALAAGDEGMGRMAEPDEIAAAVVTALGPHDLEGARILVTAGPTHEPIDAVRFLGNRSSGRMGFAVAADAARRGARVTLVAGPVALDPPFGVDVIRVETAAEMSAAVGERFEACDAVVMAAAVADFRPAAPREDKIKKEGGPPALRLEPTEDILAGLGKRKGRQILVGFAAETGDVLGEGRRKLSEKNLDLLVANRVGTPGTGFGSETNEAAVLSREGADESLRQWTKAELASAICDRLARLLRERRNS
jgi:phosphopantothenoylcysteine decarboxylase / phosphopantothenate---cysteine ligase